MENVEGNDALFYNRRMALPTFHELKNEILQISIQKRTDHFTKVS